MNVPLVVLGASTSPFTFKNDGNVQTLHQQPQQAKVEEEDVDACDIIYLLLGFLVQMIMGEVPIENWEGFMRSIHPCRSQDDHVFSEQMRSQRCRFFSAPTSNRMCCVFSEWTSNWSISGLRGGKKSPFEDRTSLSFFLKTCWCFLISAHVKNEYHHWIQDNVGGVQHNWISIKQTSLISKTFLKPPKRHTNPHWEHDDSGFVCSWSFAKGLSHEVYLQGGRFEQIGISWGHGHPYKWPKVNGKLGLCITLLGCPWYLVTGL